MHGKNAAVPFAASRNIRLFFFFFFVWLEFIGAFLEKITESMEYSDTQCTDTKNRQQNHKHGLDVLAHCTEL